MTSVTPMLLFAAVAASVTAPPSPAGAQTPQPSFNCDRAILPSEVAICSDDHLAQLDQAAAIAFDRIPGSDRAAARQARNEVLAARNACGADRLCVMDQQINALQTYDSFGPTISIPPWVGAYRLSLAAQRGRPLADRLPVAVGECAKTKITAITTRFGETLKPPVSDDVDPGTAVSFANKGYQVTYTYEPAIARSAIGDPVLICLVSLPKDCPKGDDRGKVYATTNFRTQGSWLMADSQHLCGGA